MYKNNTFMKISLPISFQFFVLMFLYGCPELMANRIKVGEAEISINIKCPDSLQLPQSLTALILSSSIFDKSFEYDHHTLQKSDNGFIGKVPVDTETVDVGIIISDSIQPYLIGLITLSQNHPVTMECTFTSDSLICSKINPQEGFNIYTLHSREENPTLQAAEVVMRGANYHIGLSDNEPDFEKIDDREQLKKKIVDLKETIRAYSFDNVKLPLAIEDWVNHILEYDCAGQWLMSYKRLNVPTEIDLPIEAYKVLDAIDREKMYYDRLYCLGPYSFFKILLTNYPIEIPSIDDSDVRTWKSNVKDILKGSIEEPSDEFLNMLTLSSYKMQVDEGIPLSQKQIANIEKDLPLDYIKIIKKYNNYLTESEGTNSNRVNFLDQKFSIKSYISEFTDKKFICVDLWNTWCMPCVLEIRARRSADFALQFPEVEFLSICDTSSNIEEWEKYSDLIEGKSLIITSESMEQIFNDYRLEPTFPTHLLLDHQGKLLKVSVGFMLNEELKAFLEEERN